MACPPRETFQIGWICALPIEAAAAKEMLDEHFGILDVQDQNDSNTYTLGRVGKHYVVIACLPGGQYGTTSATTVANNMVRTFSKSFRIGLMVGVGGGIPSPTYDIRLGDVVISCPEGLSGGVLQYDMGKVGARGEFHRIGSLNSPPRALLTAINSLRAAELTDEPDYPGYLLKAIGRTTRTQKNFGRPQQDRLFKLEHNHPKTANNCDRCLAEWEETRSERDTSNPQTHYGVIASGNAVIKDAYTREQLRLATGALCFEMESAGLMVDFPCIVIRGICDYADMHKNKQWQGYAALAAASYAKELLEYVPIGHVSQEDLVVDKCKGLKEEIEATNRRLDRVYSQREQHYQEQKFRALTDQQQRCHQVFKIANYTEQKNINPKRAEGTCQWVSNSDEYVRWSKSCRNDLLWVSADPGCGKSVLAKSIVDDHLKKTGSEVIICHFFFKDNDEQNSLATALCAILHQFFCQRPDLLHYAIPSWEKNGERLQHEADELWRIFLIVTSAETSCKTVCVLDALDECCDPDQGRLIEKLESFYCQSHSSTQEKWLRFLVTSRPYNHIQYQFRVIMDSFPCLHLKGEEENDRIHAEIDLVVKVRVRELAKLARLPSAIEQQLEERLLQMDHRTYLWLHLAIEDIQETFKNSLRPAKESIRLIPTSVNAAYRNLLSRVPLKQIGTVVKILRIILASRRPLTIREMAMALGIAISPYSKTAAEAGLDPNNLDKKIRQLCGLFVFTNNSKIYLIHQTAREFLLRTETADYLFSGYSFSSNAIEGQMAGVCLRYLWMEDLENNEAYKCSNSGSFLEYSAVYWPDHVRNSTSALDSEENELLYQLYNTTTERFSLWFPLFWRAMGPYGAPTMNGIHLAAFNGHLEVIQRQLSEDETILDIADSTGSCPLKWASFNGHHDVVQLMLNYCADVNTPDSDHGTILHAACIGGHDKVVQVLLDSGAKIDTDVEGFGTALQVACDRGYDKIVQILLESGVEINTPDGYYGSAYKLLMLLDGGADTNTWNAWCDEFEYGSALQAACFNGHDKIVMMLLENGANVSAQGGKYGTALHAACDRGHSKVVQMLLGGGANIDTGGGYYGTALQTACFRGHDNIKITDLMLMGKIGKCSTALQITCGCRSDKIVRMLLNHGANVNIRPEDHGTALQVAPGCGHNKIIQMLPEGQVELNSKSRRYENAL
ncbi:hypothetical protein N7448_004385 [Penicillium atrosanguineum]|nr:hypothetical protein N7448_004385 [Penicillium atrosanguineum]